MITRLHVENVLSMRDVEVELGKLNVLIGPNASGKSNVIKVLQLLGNYARSGEPSLPGYDFKSLAYGFNELATAKVEVEVEVKGHTVSYSLSLTREYSVERAWMGGREIFSSDSRTQGASYLTRDGTMVGLHRGLSIGQLPIDACDELNLLSRFLKGIVAYSFSPDRVRAYSPIHHTVPPALGYYGDNLARVLLHLYLEHRKVFAQVEDALRSLVPEVEEVIPHLEGDRVALWLRVRGVDEPLRPSNISDGTLRLLAFIVALYSGSSVVALEEPENCIHPHLLEALIDLARKAPCQLVITTHSPYLLDHVKPEEVYVVSKVGTETNIRRLCESKEVEAVRRFLEEGGTLGEAWYSGLIGGSP